MTARIPTAGQAITLDDATTTGGGAVPPVTAEERETLEDDTAADLVLAGLPPRPQTGGC